MKELYLLEKKVTEKGFTYTIYDSSGYSEKKLPENTTEEQALETLRIYNSTDLEHRKRVIRYGRQNQKSYCLYEINYRTIYNNELEETKFYSISFNKDVIYSCNVDSITEDAMIEKYESLIKEKFLEHKPITEVIKIY